jgi:hypothetical protein
MSNNTNRPTNKKLSFVENANTLVSFFGNLGGWLLGIGLFLILVNIVVFLGIDIRPRAWLCYLDMRYWSGYISIALWIAAIWLVVELTDLVENYQSFARVSLVICTMLAIVYALYGAFNITRAEYSFWFNCAIVVAVCCAVRSLFLLYEYQYEGEESIDLEEAQWFWGLSGLFLSCLAVLGAMCVIPVKTSVRIGADQFVTESLFLACYNGLRDLIRSGQGSFMLLIFGVLVLMISVAFIYVASMWMLVVLSKMREN